MALPKRRQSKTRGKKRRTHYKSNPINITINPNYSKNLYYVIDFNIIIGLNFGSKTFIKS